MKQIFFTLCVFFVFLLSANAGEMYSCTDSNGNQIVTDSPQDGMKCELKDTVNESRNEGVAEKEKSEKEKVGAEKDKTIVKSERARQASINKCLSCCGNKQQVCYNYTADNMLCNAEYTNCVATCKSEGSSPSSWSDCWSQSAK